MTAPKQTKILDIICILYARGVLFDQNNLLAFVFSTWTLINNSCLATIWGTGICLRTINNLDQFDLTEFVHFFLFLLSMKYILLMDSLDICYSNIFVLIKIGNAPERFITLQTSRWAESISEIIKVIRLIVWPGNELSRGPGN